MGNKDKQIRDITNTPPQYVIKKPKFYCQVSPYIMWHHGLQFNSCPLASEQRDDIACEKCHLRGDSKAKIKHRKKPSREYKKATTKIEKKLKEKVPNIGKTFVSE